MHLDDTCSLQPETQRQYAMLDRLLHALEAEQKRSSFRGCAFDRFVVVHSRAAWSSGREERLSSLRLLLDDVCAL